MITKIVRSRHRVRLRLYSNRSRIVNFWEMQLKPSVLLPALLLRSTNLDHTPIALSLHIPGYLFVRNEEYLGAITGVEHAAALANGACRFSSTENFASPGLYYFVCFRYAQGERFLPNGRVLANGWQTRHSDNPEVGSELHNRADGLKK